MKKISLVLCCFLLTQLSSSAILSEYYCPKQPYALSSSISGNVAKYSGANFVTKQLTEKLIANVLKDELKADFDFQLKPFENNNLLNGKFKSLSVFGKNANWRGFYISALSANTVCGFNHIKYENSTLYFLENTVVKYSARINEKDLKQTLNSNEYISSLRSAKIKANNKVLAEVSDVDMSIKNDKILMSIDLNIPFVFGSVPQKISLTSGLSVENGKIIFDEPNKENNFLDMLLKSSMPLLEKINPFVYKVQTKDKYDIILNVEKASGKITKF